MNYCRHRYAVNVYVEHVYTCIGHINSDHRNKHRSILYILKNEQRG